MPERCPLLDGLAVVEIGEGITLAYAGRILADLGACVVKVDADADEVIRPRRGLSECLNAGKVQLAVRHGDDGARSALASTVDGADVLLVSDHTAPHEALGRSPAELRAHRPELIVSHCRPSAGWPGGPAPAVAASALSGESTLVGEAGRPPLPLPYDLTQYVTGAALAAATLSAVIARETGGPGQVVEVDEDEVLLYGHVAGRLIVPPGVAYRRAGRRFPGSGGPYPFGLFPCKDGDVAIVGRSDANWRSLLQALGDPPWAADPRFADAIVVGRCHADEVDALLGAVLEAHTRAELVDLGRRAGVAIGPVLSIAEVVSHPHFSEPALWSDPINVDGRRLRYVKAPYRFSRTPIPSGTAVGPPTRRPAGRAERRTPTAHRTRPLAGIRVVDFTVALAGPIVAAALADLGAEVIKVEHRNRPDNARLRARPERDGAPVPGPRHEVSFYYHQNNRGKRSAAINIKDPEGQALVRQLIRRADLVIDNLSPGVFDRVHLGYEDLAAEHPSLVWLSLSAFGQTGVLAGTRGYAPIMTAAAGLESLVGYEGEEPVGALATAYGDLNGAWHGLVAALAALRHARRTGVGQFVDANQSAATLATLCEPVAEYLLGRTEPRPAGMGHPLYEPHGHYPCRGSDAWIALWVAGDDEWRALVDVIADDALTALRRADRAQRRAARRSVTAAIVRWTGQRTPEEAAATLQAAGVGAVAVLGTEEAHRRWCAAQPPPRVEHPVTGAEDVFPVPFRLSETPVWVERAAPLLGEHTRSILRDLLDIDQVTIDRLFESGVCHGPVDELHPTP